MKNLMPAVLILAAALTASILIYASIPLGTSVNRASWNYKKKETINRLLATPIILYHNIDGKGPFSIKLEELRSHFQMMKESGISVIKLSELIERLENPVPFEKKSVVITFDDGYASMYTKLLPLVKEFGYPVTLFVYIDAVGGRGKLTWDMLRKLDMEGIDIQSHTISHSDAVKLVSSGNPASREKLYSEIYLSKRVLELYLNKKIEYFAFPYGRYDLKAVDYAQDAGYRRVFSTDYGSNIILNNNYCLRRQHIKSDYTLDYVKSLVQ